MNNYNKMTISSVLSILFILFLGYSFSFLTDKFTQEKQDASEKPVVQKEKLTFKESPYQDIIVKNKVKKRGRGPDFESKYKVN